MIQPSNPITIILADDHELFRDGFRVMLSKQHEILLVAEASNGEELLAQARQLHPDVIVTDIKMPKMDGIEVTRRISQELPQIGIIALSMFDDENLIVDMIEAGAKGYLIKNAGKAEIIEAVKTVYEEGSYYCNHTSKKLAQLLAQSNTALTQRMHKVTFSDREQSIIQLICEEYANKEIAGKLFLSTRTIESYREKILEKMQVKNTAGIVVYAIKNGLYKIKE